MPVMTNKVCRNFTVFLKSLWAFLIAAIPTVIWLTPYFNGYEYFWQEELSISVYFIPIISIGIVTLVCVFILKKADSLFALSCGFILELFAFPLIMYLHGGVYWRHLNYGFGGVLMSMMVLAIIYSMPLAVISFLMGSLLRNKFKKAIRNPQGQQDAPISSHISESSDVNKVNK